MDGTAALAATTKRMKGVIMGFRRAAAFLSCALFLAAAAGLASQDAPAPGTGISPDTQEEGRTLLRQFSLQPRELDQIERILAKDEDALAKARAEIQIAQARLARLMLDHTVDMSQVRDIVKGSLDWELQVRMIQIGRQIAIRNIVGDERWAAMFKMSRYLALLERSGRLRAETGQAGGQAADLRARLIALLLRLN